MGGLLWRADVAGGSVSGTLEGSTLNVTREKLAKLAWSAIVAAPVEISLTREITDNLFADTSYYRLALSFQDKLGETAAREWIQNYNQKQEVLLTYERPLRNLLHLVGVVGVNPMEAHKRCVEEEVLQLDNPFAAVNDYNADFDDGQPADLKQIIIVLIPSVACPCKQNKFSCSKKKLWKGKENLRSYSLL
ncbi:hypothetical protein R1flu_014823 [Riccia fluitans]|uniref:Uncharacterized protein n=1 Tax=Riccia fluitans TaxID=41844 RepID=A0ABD1YHC7_9MARC